MTHIYDDVPPAPPHRLHSDRRMLNARTAPDCTGRRANKMRERFAVMHHDVVPGLSLIAPVQPSVAAPTRSGLPLL